MVTRVDRKPLIYNSTLLRAWRPAVVSTKKALIDSIASRSCGCNVPKSSAREIMDSYEDVEAGFRSLGIADPMFNIFNDASDADGDESIRMGRVFMREEKNIRRRLRDERMMEEVAVIQAQILSESSAIYYGTEAVYMLLGAIHSGNIFENIKSPTYAKWVSETARKVLLTQSTYMFIHPSAIGDMADKMALSFDGEGWFQWDIYKRIETMALKITSKKNLFAHSALYGINKKGFTASDNPVDDFELKMHSEAGCNDKLKVHILLGLKYYTIGGVTYVLSADDCINLATMGQCMFRTAIYFTPFNGYSFTKCRQAISLIKDITYHCCNLIRSGTGFANAIRSMHVLAQAEFNDAFEDQKGIDLGWRERSDNYMREAKALDPAGIFLYKRAVDLARDTIDKLNVGFIYHAFIGDEMLISDLRSKVAGMSNKVQPADPAAWKRFISFCKAYFLARFITVNKRKPKCAGELSILNEKWADRCINGQFTMPQQSTWGKVWISKEFTYTRYADLWHLEAQDVSYVMKDAKGMVNNTYRKDKFAHSELIMAMTSGNILDTLTGSTPKTARDRIRDEGRIAEVVVTTAPKAENAKPSWKKRVTFAADCEFRKMQAEHDRNCRKIVTFVRGPSLGVDQCILEKQFADICRATTLGTAGAVCSHDISAWSESMDRARKFEFESILSNMLEYDKSINIRYDWDNIKAVVNKQGTKDIVSITNGSFQGFDGSASTILHSMILLYCIDTARRKSIMGVEVKTNMATLIDDCIALMDGLTNESQALAFWSHLKETYKSLGFEVDDLKSIFSTIKAIYLSRRFLNGAEVPSDFKVFVKTHMSYEDPLRCSVDAPSDIMGALRGAADANGNAWYIYYVAVASVLAEIVHSNSCVMKIPPAAAAIFALAPSVENGWGIPSIVDWSTNDVVDKRSHFNAIMESISNHANSPEAFQGTRKVFPRSVGQAIMAIKSQPWRMVSLSNLFTNPFECVRDGPMKPDMLKRNAVQELLREIATASPWKDLLEWNISTVTEDVRRFLIGSGCLHAPTLAAMVNCMPDNYRLSLVGKAIGSQSVLNQIPRGMKSVLKRRVGKCAANYFSYCVEIYNMTKGEYTSNDFGSLNYYERTRMEREEFYAANGCSMTDHTFPDPVATFAHIAEDKKSLISPNLQSAIIWDREMEGLTAFNQLISPKGMYVPKRSGRVWEITSEHAKGWDSVSQRIAMGLAILARAESDGHRIEGLLEYFVKSWNELSNITPNDTHLISIHGSIKRLDANPGSSTHPIIVHRNLLRAFNNNITTSINAITSELAKMTGSSAHLHDPLSHETCMLAVTCLQASTFFHLNVADCSKIYLVGTRPDCIVPECQMKMTTHTVADKIRIAIMDGEDNYGLLQACPDLAVQIAVPTMKASWVRMINALIDGDLDEVETIRKMCDEVDIDLLLQELKDEEVMYTSSVILAKEPAERSSLVLDDRVKYTIVPHSVASSTKGDGYTIGVSTAGAKIARELSHNNPDFISIAVAIKSIVWDRLRNKGVISLASVYYQDPDADSSALETATAESFWRGVVVEVNKHRGKRRLTEALMMGFKSLGIPQIHFNASDDISEVTHSVASYFGANKRHITFIVADQILHLAGRNASDFAKPLLQRVVTNNPSLLDIKLKKEHMTSLISTNKLALADRIEKILNNEIKHRGDLRAAKIDIHPRLVELRCRRYVYMSFHVDERANAIFNAEKFFYTIAECENTVRRRLSLEEVNESSEAYSFTKGLDVMKRAQERFEGAGKIKESGWDFQSGSIGARLAYDMVLSDSYQVQSTKFAVSAAEIAPRLYRRIVRVDPIEVAKKGEVSLDVACPVMDDDDEGFDPFADDGLDLFAAASSHVSGLNLPAWQALYTLLYNGTYSGDDVNKALGTSLPAKSTTDDLREAYLDTFSDDAINRCFPSLTMDYMQEGVIFDPEWLNRDEADAYTTEELGKRPGSYLF